MSSGFFDDAAALTDYAERTRRLVPGFPDLPRMAALLLAERAPEEASILVIGAGGGVELATFARMYPRWSFVGVDPSEPMLDLARAALGSSLERAQLHHGYVDTAPMGPFDGATCLLTMHFIPPDERRRTLQEIRSRLRPGAPFVMAHMSFPPGPEWLARYVAFAISSGVEPEKVQNAAEAIEKNLHLLAPDEEETMLAEAGFENTQLFYAGFTFRGWVTQA